MEKNISFSSGIAIAVSMVVGSGLLGLPGLAIEKAGAITALWGWLFVIATMPPLIHIFSKLGVRYTSAAGISKYAEETLGAWSGYGVQLVFCGTFIVGMPAFAMVGGAYSTTMFGLNENKYGYLFAIIFITISTVLNVLGVKVTSWVNKAALLTLLALVLYIVISNFELTRLATPELLANLRKSDLDYFKIWSVGAIIFWAFQGWENLSFGLEEFKSPEKTIPKVFWTSFFMVSVLYLMLAWTASAAVIMGKPVIGVAGLASLVSDNIFKEFFIAAMVLILLANANSWVFGVSRMFFSAGQSGLLPKLIGKLDNKGIPRNSLIILAVFYIVAILLIQFFQIPISNLFLATTQNFLFLYGVTILAFLKVQRGLMKYIVVTVATVSWLFLLAGFSWWIFYPISLMMIGGLIWKKYRGHEIAPKN